MIISSLINLLAADGNNSGWIIWVIMGVMMVGLVVLTVIPNNKRKKEYQKMQEEIRVGTRIMTIGRLIGTVVRKYDNDTLEVDIGTPGNPVVITINRDAIGINLDAQEAARQAQAAREAAKRGEVPKSEGEQATAEALANEESALPELEEAKEDKKDDGAI